MAYQYRSLHTKPMAAVLERAFSIQITRDGLQLT